MSRYIDSELKRFKATAFHNGEFVDVSSDDIKGKWAIFFFYPADFTFVCPTELGDLADNYEEFKKFGRGNLLCFHRHPLHSQSLARNVPTPSARSSTRCWATRPAPSPATSVS